ncbi:hypothetical protein [Saccharopolyspora flava]|uniref:Uncharacterized protein n=1 Tax=Saccharopolyspora flava TaxID=95161 RepID=A0A1I6SXA7_9PSEU|nr:hypothetical protein [Saccharopolyspora flava]SFS81523.1 hypothetical protein SAMN05660874_03512 [Saccharopolyspora flava]
MPAQPPAPLRLWWKSPLVVRLLPALALITATGAGVVANLPTTPDRPQATPPRPQVVNLAPTTTAPPPPPETTTAAPTTSSQAPTSTTTPTRSSTRTTTSTAPPPPPPPPETTTAPTTTSTSRQHSPEVTEGQPCDEPGDVARGEDGDRYVCDYTDGAWRWQEW